METESPSNRNRGKKLSSNKLSALEKLKKARLGEKIEDEEEEEELYDYVEEDDYEDEEEEFVSKKKSNSSKHSNNNSDKSSAKKQQPTRRHLTSNKTLNDDEEESATKNDIRTAFFKVATNSNQAKLKSEKKMSETSAASNSTAKSNDDDLANEIMLELLQNKKANTKSHVPLPPKPIPKPNFNSHNIPFSLSPSVRNTSNNSNISLSPAHKRKLSPSVSSNSKLDKLGINDSQSKCKKLELDDELVQQLFDNDSQPFDFSASITNEIKTNGNKGSTHLADVSNATIIKTEPVDFMESKKNDLDEDEALENLELLSQLTLEASNNALLSKQLNLPVKQENLSSSFNNSMNMSASIDDMDVQMHIKNQSKSNKLLFYWIDAFEDTYNLNGTIYLFGKMPIVVQKNLDKTQNEATTQNTDAGSSSLTFLSVCCIIKNIPKVAYVLPRKYRKTKTEEGNSDEIVTMSQVAKEIDSLMDKFKISTYKTKVVKKFYAFDKRSNTYVNDVEIPYETEYLEIEYTLPNQNHQWPKNIEGEYFSCILGTQTSYLEHFLIDLKIKGPCWLLSTNALQKDASNGSGSMVSWCKLEYTVDNYRSIGLYHDGVTLDQPKIQLPSTPPLTILTLLTKTMLNTKTQEHEIVCACGLVSNKFYLEKATMPTTIASNNKQQQPPIYDSYFCALTKPTNAVFPYDFQNVIKNMHQKFRIELCGSERALLAFLLCKIHSLDADVIVGHDLFGFNIDIILNRCVIKKVPHWSRMGRLKRANMPNSNNLKSSFHNTALNNIITQQRIQTVCSGRLLCDIMLSAKELLTKCKSFDLNDLVAHILLKKDAQLSMITRDYEEEKNVSNYYSSSELLVKFLQLSMMDATNITRICNDLQAIQLAYQITCIAGNVLSRTLVGGRSERNEYLLLHAFNDKEFILPDKYSGSQQKQMTSNNTKKKPNQKNNASKVVVKTEPNTTASMIKMELENDEDEDDKLLSTLDLDMNNETQAADETKFDEEKKITAKSANTHVISSNGYTGGLVLEPKVGFYDRFILLLDFNSLYPSIIQEFNICFTTINRPCNELLDKNVEEYLETCIKLPSPDEKQGILPLEIRKLVDSRRQVKQLMQDKSLSTDLKMQYDIRQKALKLTANSVYGCLGFENSRFYCKPLAALITKNGRNILMKTKELVENKKIEVIYGDTDSIMINTNLIDYDQVLKLGNMLKAEVNKLYKHLEIDIDGVFKCLLLLRKKKYAALTITGRNQKDNTLQFQQEIKGLDVVRRDWCLLAKQIGEKVISEILSGQNCDTVLTNINKILNETAEKIKNKSFDLSLFEISKQLNRNPEDYSDAIHQPHVLVALRHNQDVNNSKKFKSGNVVSYIICEDGTQNSSTQRAYSKSELLKNTDNKLTLDTRYYLTQQIHPIITRLCEPIEGMDAYHIAQSLGLDPTGFKHKNSSSNNGQVNIAPAHLSKQQKKLESFMNELEKFSNSIPFKYTCPECKHESIWQAPFIKMKTTLESSSSNTTTVHIKKEPLIAASNVKLEALEIDDDGIEIDETSFEIKTKNNKPNVNSNFRCILDSCSNPKCKVRPVNMMNYIKNLLTLQLNKYIKQYYQSWLVCEDPMCSFRTKRLSCKFVNARPQCIECERYATELEYSHSDLYYQMRFLKFIFDIDAYKSYYKDDAAEVANLLRNNKDLAVGLNQLKDHVNKKLKNNSYGCVNLTDIFKYC